MSRYNWENVQVYKWYNQRIKRWESVPNHREPVTKEMTEYVVKKGKSIKDNLDNIYSALGDWLVLGKHV